MKKSRSHAFDDDNSLEASIMSHSISRSLRDQRSIAELPPRFAKKKMVLLRPMSPVRWNDEKPEEISDLASIRQNRALGSPFLQHFSSREKEMFLLKLGSINDLNCISSKTLQKEVIIQSKLMELLSPIKKPSKDSIFPTLKSPLKYQISIDDEKQLRKNSHKKRQNKDKKTNSNDKKLAELSSRNVRYHTELAGGSVHGTYATSVDYNKHKLDDDQNSINSDFGVFESELVSVSNFDEEYISDEGSSRGSYRPLRKNI